jgi:hypothetical protein
LSSIVDIICSPLTLLLRKVSNIFNVLGSFFLVRVFIAIFKKRLSIDVYLIARWRIITRSAVGARGFFRGRNLIEKAKQLLAPLLRLRAVFDGFGFRKRGTKIEMIKKTREVNLAAGTEELVAVNNSLEANLSVDNRSVSVEQPLQQEKVNSIIHEWLTDMWLLTTGEEMNFDLTHSKKHNGRVLAIVCDGQMRLMESRPVTLDALRAVGIEMS